MEKDILSRVIEVEREIQEKLREEKRRTLEWIGEVKKEAEEQLAKEEERVKEFFRKTVDDTGAAAEREAAELLRDSALQGERLAGLGDDALTGVVLKYIWRIVPADSSSEKGARPSP